MRVAERRVGDEQLFLRERPRGKFFGAEFEQQLPRSLWRSLFVIVGRDFRRGKSFFGNKTFRVRIAIHGHVADEA